MTRREDSEARLTEALDAYRAAAHAEADSYFDERALEAQRLRILSRLEQAGHRARVLPFPGTGANVRLGTSHPRRWIERRRGGRLVHRPRDRPAAPHHARRQLGASESVRIAAPAGPRMAIVPAVVTTSLDPEDALLDAIDAAVTRQGASDLRAFDDITFSDPY